MTNFSGLGGSHSCSSDKRSSGGRKFRRGATRNERSRKGRPSTTLKQVLARNGRGIISRRRISLPLPLSKRSISGKHAAGQAPEIPSPLLLNTSPVRTQRATFRFWISAPHSSDEQSKFEHSMISPRTTGGASAS